MRICPRCGFKDPAQIAAAARYEEKRIARRKLKRAQDAREAVRAERSVVLRRKKEGDK